MNKKSKSKVEYYKTKFEKTAVLAKDVQNKMTPLRQLSERKTK